MCHTAIAQEERLAVEGGAAIFDEQIGAIHKDVEAFTKTVGKGDVFKNTFSIEKLILHLLVMGQDIDCCDTKSR